MYIITVKEQFLMDLLANYHEKLYGNLFSVFLDDDGEKLTNFTVNIYFNRTQVNYQPVKLSVTKTCCNDAASFLFLLITVVLGQKPMWLLGRGQERMVQFSVYTANDRKQHYPLCLQSNWNIRDLRRESLNFSSVIVAFSKCFLSLFLSTTMTSRKRLLLCAHLRVVYPLHSLLCL